MGLMKQAKEMQAKMEAAQATVADLRVLGASGAGMVEIGLTGENNIWRLKIDPKLLSAEDAEIVEDLIIAAYQDAKVKIQAKQAETMKGVMGDIPMPPGLGL